MKITIPKPCHENWNEMTPNEMGRHCAVCSKTVRDFTDCTYEEIYNELNANKNMCGRFNDNQLDRDFYQETINQLFSKFAIGFVLTATGMLSVSGQQIISDKKVSESTKKVLCNPLKINIPENDATLSLKGRVGAIRTVKSTDQPLYVIDEKVSDSLQVAEFNPKNINSIKLLKGNEAINLYGEKGANGVILITTKKKEKSKKR
ncbi:hypothetical protein [Chryseobacterium sp.]|uniref:hypothetical protein n=1 Tax=Chryseobacterium sp. TaxID=1871047 RepID=UPI002896F0C2|nr:hypothetical protein [Chryseobacterium sp.]